MKFLKRLLLILATTLIIVVVLNYPKLNIIAGYSAKNMSSSVFLAERTLALTDSTDNNFGEVSFATDKIDKEGKYATASVFGLLTRKAVHREGLGSVLITDDFDIKEKTLIPKRSVVSAAIAYPYGNGAQKTQTGILYHQSRRRPAYGIRWRRRHGGVL